MCLRPTGQFVSVLFLLSVAFLSGREMSAQTLAPGFADTLVANVPAPTAIAALPGGELLVSSQGGTLRLVSGGVVRAEPVLTISSLCANSERGLLGIAVDPDYSQNSFIYLYYTFRRPDGDCSTRSDRIPVNRVSRFTMGANTRIDPATEHILIDNIPSYGGNHNGGDLQFGPLDRMLYISVGDAGCDPRGTGGCAGGNTISRETNTLLGKILRIDRDGNVPPGNPWTGAGSARCHQGDAAAGARCQETYAWGFRNPFRIALDVLDGRQRLYANDVGQSTWEEIDNVLAGEDYGWNAREGFCATGSTTNCSTGAVTAEGYRNPVFAYGRRGPVPGTESSGCGSLTGAAFIPPGIWTPGIDGFLFADFVCGSIMRLGPDNRAHDLARGLGGVVALAFAPYQNTTALYYTTYAGGGQLRQITAFVVATAGTFARGVLTPAAYATVFGTGLDLATTVSVRDGAGIESAAEIIFRSETQLNLLLPGELAPGDAVVTMRSSSGVVGTAPARIESVWPDVLGVQAARYGGGSPEPLPIASPIDPGSGDVYLTIYATGARAAVAVEVLFDTTPGTVTFFGPQGEFAGLEQINVLVPAEMSGRGPTTVTVRANGIDAPAGELNFQ